MRCLYLVALSLFGLACRNGLQVGGPGADSGPVECVGSPPEACGYACHNGKWIRIPLLCAVPDGAIPVSPLPDSAVPDSAIPDSAVPDSAVPDSALPDSALPDSLGHDANGFEVQVTDTNRTHLDGAEARTDAGTPVDCLNIDREWLLAGSCLGPRASFNGTFVARMTQTGCRLTFTQTDDNTETKWTATGVLESTGQGYLKGSFGFTDASMCDLTVTTTTGWDMVCGSATQQCKLQARTLPDLY